MALSSECEVHEWSWDPADDMGCPVCHGMEEERERIIKLIEELRQYSIEYRKGRQVDVLLPEVRYQRLIDRIKGENK